MKGASFHVNTIVTLYDIPMICTALVAKLVFAFGAYTETESVQWATAWTYTQDVMKRLIGLGF